MSDALTIYVELLNEGVQVWRPVAAEHVRDDIYRIVGRHPDDEEWQFATGDLVRCRNGNGEGLIAHERAAALGL